MSTFTTSACPRCAAAIRAVPFQRRHVVVHGGNRHDVVAVILQRVDVGAGGSQRAHGVMAARIGRDVQRRAAMTVARVDRSAARDQRLDARHITALRGVEQPGIAHDVGGGGRYLRGALAGDERHQQRAHHHEQTHADRAIQFEQRASMVLRAAS
jgi:hypothetical protein